MYQPLIRRTVPRYSAHVAVYYAWLWRQTDNLAVYRWHCDEYFASLGIKS